MENTANSINEKNNIIKIKMHKNGEIAPINQLILDAPDGSTIQLEKGKYSVDETIQIKKTIQIVGKGAGVTILEGKNLPVLINFSGEHQIYLEGLTFKMSEDSDNVATIAQVNNKEFLVKGCEFSNGKHSKDGHIAGIGLLIQGSTKTEISDCLFKNNEEFGLLITDHVTAKLTNCQFTINDSGASAVDQSELVIENSQLFKNIIGITYDKQSTGKVNHCVLSENRAGIMGRGNATPKLHLNIISKNKIGVASAENANIMVMNNDITESDIGINAIQESEILIEENRISNNRVGVFIKDEANAEILNNQIFWQEENGIQVSYASANIQNNIIFENSRSGIKAENNCVVKIGENHIVGNLRIGIVVYSIKIGEIYQNTVKNNGFSNISVENSNKIRLKNNFEDKDQVRPVEFDVKDGVIVILPPESGEKVSLNEVIAFAKPNQTVLLKKGYYILSEPVIIDKPIKLVAEVPQEVIIHRGIQAEQSLGELECLVNYIGSGTLLLSGICFNRFSHRQSNVIRINSGNLEMDQCTVTGGNDPKQMKRDFGAGVLIRGAAKGMITNSIFKDNILGVSVIDTADVSLIDNFCFTNGYGIIFRDQSKGYVKDNDCRDNLGFGSLAYDQSTVNMIGNKSYRNTAGIGLINQSQGVIENNEAFENKSHGIFVDHNSESMIRGNNCHHNQDSGIGLAGDANSQIIGNECCQNGKYGINVFENVTAQIINNQCSGNSVSGLYVGGSSTAKVSSNEITQNEIGIYLDESAKTEIMNNIILHNVETDIEDRSDSEQNIGKNEMDIDKENPSTDDEDDFDKEEFKSFLINQLGLDLEDLVDDPEFRSLFQDDESAEASGDEP